MSEEKRKRKNEDIPIWTWGRSLVVIGLAIVYGLVIYAIGYGPRSSSLSRFRQTDTMITTFVAIIPLIIGIVYSYTIPRPRLTLRNQVRVAIPVAILFLASTVVAYPWLALCGLMGTPIILIGSAIVLLLIKAVMYVDGKSDWSKRKR